MPIWCGGIERTKEIKIFEGLPNIESRLKRERETDRQKEKVKTTFLSFIGIDLPPQMSQTSAGRNPRAKIPVNNISENY